LSVSQPVCSLTCTGVHALAKPGARAFLIQDMAEKVQKGNESQLCRKCRSFFGQVQTDFLCSQCFKSLPPASPPVAAPSSPPVPQVEETKAEVKETLSRCKLCERRLGPMQFPCKCGGCFCARHRVPEDHACTFDHRTLGVKRLADSNPLVVAEKVRKL